MIPGLGFVPMFAIDMYISQIDPVTHPEEWQERVDMFSEFIPSVGFQQGGMVSRLVGGGTAGEVTSNFLNLTSAFSGTSNYSLSSEFFGEIDREIERTRALSAILADEEEWDALFAFNTVEDFNTYLDSIALSADRAATYEQSFLDIARWAVPVSHHGDESVTQLLNVWATAAEMFPESLQARPSLRNADLSNDEQLRAYTDDIRSAFFALDPDERNRLIVQYPQLAINMVSSWRWTNKALEANLPGTDQAYRSTGDRRGRALHQNYVTLNYIRPLDPVERAKRILGTVWNAQEKVGRQVYTDMAGRVNDHLWEKVVTPETRTLLTNILNTGFGERWGFESERELWEKWPTVEKDFELWAAEQQGFVEGSEMFDRVKETINIPGKEKSWGTSWPGLDDQELSKRFKELTINRFPDNVVANAEAIGLELTPGMTGYQLFQGLQGYLSTNNNAAFLASQSVYRNYQQDR
ncbi:MAG: hypothetical protein GWO44_17800, partial [Thermoplasmata archaeon]|nr:hypothetical protein [Thermoplasmata archaeon]NIY05054.1 hypothetical protein [Thermoplasmata archaeon]